MTHTPSHDRQRVVSRRTLVSAGAWAVPVLSVGVAVPASAATSSPSTGVARFQGQTPKMQVPALGSVTVTYTAYDSEGNPISGEPVSLSGPSGVSFSPENPILSNGTTTSVLTNSNRWTRGGKTVSTTGSVRSTFFSSTFTVLGANAWAIGANDSSGRAGTPSTTGPLTTATQLTTAFPSPIKLLSPGSDFSVALLEDGTVWTVGGNAHGQLGDGTTTSRSSWAMVPDVSSVSQIAAGNATVLALSSTGQIFAWGANSSGQLGNGGTADSSVPVTVSGITTAGAIALGSTSGYAILNGGTVQAWGSNADGQLGNNSTTSSATPVTVSGITTASQIAACGTKGTAYALLSDGTVRSWGNNDSGQLGNGKTTRSTTPVTVSGLKKVTQLVAGGASGYALLESGTVRAWGANDRGQLGNGTTANKSTSVAVSGFTNGYYLAAGQNAGYCFLNDSTPLAWGANADGELGDGTTTQSTTPVRITGTDSATTIMGGPSGTTAFIMR